MKLRLFLGMGALLAASATLAHHSFAMFDQKQVWTWEGTVVEYSWRQPHVHIIVQVPESKTNPKLGGTWDFESSGPNIGARQGWTRTTFKPGDKITVVGNPKLDGSRGASLKYAKTESGQILYHDVERKVTPENTPAT
ncbi:DUF6152 family protein [Peristeroidobacter agariperforans]|uniref:DUF6152 family protein n=1 Tax=Peristeroidobacter agariperforans TaxID=268404 RepID=UPI00101C9B8D|nr:DUF6152 family protein [Peristeroidobacter agariperforans]